MHMFVRMHMYEYKKNILLFKIQTKIIVQSVSAYMSILMNNTVNVIVHRSITVVIGNYLC